MLTGAFAGFVNKVRRWLQRIPGQHLAKMEVAKICGTIVRDYNIRQVEPEKEWSYKAYFNVVPHSWPVFVDKRH